MKSGDDISKQLLGLVARMLGLCCSDKSLDSTHDAFGENTVSCSQNFWVFCRQHILRAEKHLFIEFLARTHSGELYFNVSTDREAGQSDQVGRDLHDPYWLSHVEQENLTPASERPRLQHELYCFRNG